MLKNYFFVIMKLITETSKMIAFTEMWDEICKKRFKVKILNLEVSVHAKDPYLTNENKLKIMYIEY